MLIGNCFFWFAFDFASTIELWNGEFCNRPIWLFFFKVLPLADEELTISCRWKRKSDGSDESNDGNQRYPPINRQSSKSFNFCWRFVLLRDAFHIKFSKVDSLSSGRLIYRVQMNEIQSQTYLLLCRSIWAYEIPAYNMCDTYFYIDFYIPNSILWME